ncbi:MAG: hypothetical protein QOH71_2389 [Blastocatellia bacterium]|nr:hypothetical protein [Blastocatellia bacterium]
MTFNSRTKMLLLLPSLTLVLFATHSVASAPVLPNPVLYLIGTEAFTQGGKQFTRYKFDVDNKDAYPAAMFAAAPDLPPCGANTKSSRTWIDIFDQRGKRLYGFCALGKPSDLNQLWFALEADVVPPSWVYIEMNDRQTNTKYKSNLAETTP